MNRLCGLFGVTKQAYYKRDDEVPHRKAMAKELALQFIYDIRKKDPGIGCRKLYYMYRQEWGNAAHIGRDSFETIMSDYGLLLRRKRRKPKTTYTKEGDEHSINLIKSFIPTRPNELWVSDITYIPLEQKDGKHTFCYLSLVLDAYTEQIKGWSLGEDLSTEYPLQALTMALNSRSEETKELPLIHHSDRGTQYASRQYVDRLKQANIRISMTECGNPKDNAQAERINNTIKNELLKNLVFVEISLLRKTLEKAIAFYNNERPHMSLGMLTPAQVAAGDVVPNKMWRSYRDEAIKREQANQTKNENCSNELCTFARETCG